MKNTSLEQGVFRAGCVLADEIARGTYLHFLAEIDASGMDGFRRSAREQGEAAPSYTAFVVKAAGLALRAHPRLNAVLCRTPWGRRRVILEDVTATIAVERVHQGVDLVVAPAMAAPDRRSLGDLTRSMKRFAKAPPEKLTALARMLELARLANWSPWLMSLLMRVPALSPSLWQKFRGGSYVVTSPGKYGGFSRVLPPWPWPMTFSFGHVTERPRVVDGRVEVRKTMPLTVTADRRLAHGAELARFAKDLGDLLNHPERMESEARARAVPFRRPVKIGSEGQRPVQVPH